MGLAVVASFVDPTEAEVAAGALRSAGFAAVVMDGTFATMDWTARQALGGIRIGVPDIELPEAAELLRGLRRARPQDDTEEPETAVADKGGGWRTLAILLGAVLPLIAATIIRPRQAWQLALLLAAGLGAPFAWLVIAWLQRRGRGRESRWIPILSVSLALGGVSLAICLVGFLLSPR